MTPVLVDIIAFDEIASSYTWGRALETGPATGLTVVSTRVRHALTGELGTVLNLGAYESRWFRKCHEDGLPVLLWNDCVRWYGRTADRPNLVPYETRWYIAQVSALQFEDEPGEGRDVSFSGTPRVTTVDDSGIKRTRLDWETVAGVKVR